MLSLLAWLGILVAGAGIVTWVAGAATAGAGLFAAGVVLHWSVLLYFAHGPGGPRYLSHPGHIGCSPGGRLAGIAIVLAFVPENEAKKRPGLANLHLAGWLAANGRHFSCILTQEAVIWALEQLGTAGGFVPAEQAGDSLAGHLHGVEVHRMHRHVPGANVRTLESLRFALERFAPNSPPVIVLGVHDKQFARARRDLRSLFGGPIVNPGILNVPYQDRKALRPLCWAFLDLVVARPLEFVQRNLFPCHPYLSLPPL